MIAKKVLLAGTVALATMTSGINVAASSGASYGVSIVKMTKAPPTGHDTAKLWNAALDGTKKNPRTSKTPPRGGYGFCPDNSYLKCARLCWKRMRSCIRSAHRSGLTSVQACHRWLQGCYARCKRLCKH